ncbi:biotin transporter BioY [Hoeflea prorocentri]|uniref:Biotin transporter n=1 Tax=Hoeflea prorocentri TaxID=1922333 RepID=A0A9X3UG62_9HYPH|nr:biotin transporter BioY [Hoeflea prorocentri]MCY6380137.1 biotin transporter BioY [Hoeflea prorocentri]MDA5397937.1 biotin transporter BioY [Hoeflea prorocentri]
MTLYATLSAGRSHTLLRDLVTVVFASILLAVSAKIAVPFFPVPMTMQTLVVVGLGLALGSRLAVMAVGLYLLEGALGLPVFTGTPERGIGVAYMMGPTGGFLLGFLFAAGITGWLAERGWDRNVVFAFLAALIGAAIIYVPGLLWLGGLIGWDKPVLEFGFYPFILGDVFKAALAAAIFPAVWSFLRSRDSA